MRTVRRVRRGVLALLFIAAVPHAAASQDTAPAPADPVHFDLIVTDVAGRPIPGLQAADLELRDDGAVQTIDSVTFVSGSLAAAGVEPAPRVFGILLDEFHIDAAHTARVREALTRFLDGEIRPGDLVVLVKPLDSLATLALSDDRAELGSRMRAFEGRKGDYEPRSPFEEATMSRASAAAGPERARVVLAALGALTRRLGTLGDGRKTLVFVSEGFAELPPRGRLRGVSVQTIVETAERAGVAIYTLDPAPAPPGNDPAASDDPGRAMLQALAGQTGGVHAAADRLDEGLAAAARDLDGYYRVAYRPAHTLDGRHPIEVRVLRDEARVRTPAAHWAIPESAMALPERARVVPVSMLMPRRSQQVSRLIQTWFGTSRGADGRTRVTFTWESRPRVQPVPEWLTLTAVVTNGQVVFEGRVDPIRAIGVGGLPTLSATFEAPPGLVQIDMAIRGADGRTVDTDRRDIQVPNLHARDAVLSTPAIIRTHSALQFRTLSADPHAPPAVSRRFIRTERLLVRVHAYPAGGEAGPRPEVTARLLGRRYETLRDLEPLPDTPDDSLVQFDVPLSALPAGDYGIEIRAGSRRELVAFEVTN